jgi:dTDP-4-amino-4,6-dideoxygalactose transaminase
MTEIECAIGIEQIIKLPKLIQQRLENVSFFDEQLSNFPAFSIQKKQTENSQHTYYVYPVKFNKEIAGIQRNVFIEALKAELPSAVLRETAPLIGAGYVKPIYLQPIYQKKAAWAYNSALYGEKIDYSVGLCPTAEKMHFDLLWTHEFMRPGMTNEDMMDVINAIEKIFNNIDELR